jgi:hypothetical protein
LTNAPVFRTSGAAGLGVSLLNTTIIPQLDMGVNGHNEENEAQNVWFNDSSKTQSYEFFHSQNSQDQSIISRTISISCFAELLQIRYGSFDSYVWSKDQVYHEMIADSSHTSKMVGFSRTVRNHCPIPPQSTPMPNFCDLRGIGNQMDADMSKMIRCHANRV